MIILGIFSMELGIIKLKLCKIKPSFSSFSLFVLLDMSLVKFIVIGFLYIKAVNESLGMS